MAWHFTSALVVLVLMEGCRFACCSHDCIKACEDLQAASLPESSSSSSSASAVICGWEEPDSYCKKPPISVRDVYEELWNNNLNIAKDILNLPFLQNMEKQTLSPDVYSNFMMQDIYYAGQVTNMLKKLSETPGELQDFFKNRYNSYDKFLQTLLHDYNLKDVSCIKPIPAIKKYIDDYREIMEKEEPIYFAVGLYPCARLWPFLANELKMDETNLYYKWKKDNIDGYYEKNYKDFLNKHLQSEEEIERANKVFKQQILNEGEFFEASGQSGVERRRQGVR
ncbi:uncharacterized protein LOC101157524 [Oryzias latipes]|uniref:Thiaminase-2/PQQC domain-containing protein n=1 Tax=Oryzias latipes TaxID=8090 RepID=A0A3B3HEU9_ORYLA|nr:uncharacterized protein LOC101157524 [Oryzias latipes]